MAVPTPEQRLAALETAFTLVSGRRKILKEVPKPSKFKSMFDFFNLFRRYAMSQTDVVADQKESLYLILQTDQDKVRINSAETMLDDPAVGYDAFAKHLQAMFCPESESSMAKSEYLERRQAATESIQGYMADKRSLFDRAYAPGTPGRDETQFVQNICLGLYHTKLRVMALQWAFNMTFANYDTTVMNFASGFKLLVENRMAEEASSLGLYTSSGRPPISAPLPGGQYPESPMEVDSMRMGACHQCGETGHYKAECPKLQRGGRNTYSARNNRSSSSKQTSNAKKKPGDCDRCGHPSHWRRDCTVPAEKLAASKARNAANKKRGAGTGNARAAQPSTSSQRPNIRQLEAEQEVDPSDAELIHLLRSSDIGSMAGPVESLGAMQGFHQGSRHH